MVYNLLYNIQVTATGISLELTINEIYNFLHQGIKSVANPILRLSNKVNGN